jgi:hypothetical protein
VVAGGSNISVTGVQAVGRISPVLIWSVINDNQTPDWQPIDDTQPSNWVLVNDGNAVVWVDIPT